MTDQLESYRVYCEGGLDTTRNYLKLSAEKPGCATRLVNYEPAISGGYRRINGYEYFDADYPEVGAGVCQGKVLGVMMFPNDVTRTTEIYAARRLIATPDQYKIYQYVALTGWVEVATGLTHYYQVGSDIVDKIRYDIGNDSVQNYLAFADGVNNAVIFDGTTWAFIDSGDSGADMANAGGNQAIDAPTLVAFFSHSLFLGCDVINVETGIASYSAPDAFYNFTTASGGGQLLTGLYIVDMKPFRDTLYLFDYNKIKKATPDVTSGFLTSDVTSNMGVVARDCIVEIGGDLIFLGPDGFRPVQGTDKIGDVMLETISKQIHNLLRARTFDLIDLNVNSVVIRNKSQFRFLFGDSDTASTASRGIIAGLRTADQFNGWEFGELLGFRASVITSRMIGGDEYVLFGDYDGNVYRMEQGGSLNGTAMTAVYSTPFLDIGDIKTRKTIQSVTSFIVGEGADIDINLGIAYDWDDPNVSNPSSYVFTLESQPETYGGGASYADGSVYGGYLYPVKEQTIEGSFFSVRLTFTTSGIENPYSVLGFVIQYKTEGQR